MTYRYNSIALTWLTDIYSHILLFIAILYTVSFYYLTHDPRKINCIIYKFIVSKECLLLLLLVFWPVLLAWGPAAFSDGCYLAHVNGAYLRHVTFCIVRGSPLFIISPICQRGPLPTLTMPGWSKVHDGDVEGVEQTCRGTLASPILV